MCGFAYLFAIIGYDCMKTVLNELAMQPETTSIVESICMKQVQPNKLYLTDF